MNQPQPGADRPPEVLTVTLTAAGERLAALLPYRHHHGSLVATVARAWDEVDGLVLCCATGVAVRAIAPLLGAKHSDPAVVVVDEAGRYAVALSGGHARGANALAGDVAALLGAQAVITTASDAAGIAALDQLPGFVARGDIASVTRSWLDGHPPEVSGDIDWPLPFAGGDGPGRVVVTDRIVAHQANLVALHPPSLVVGVGASTNAPVTAAAELLDSALAAAGLERASVGLVATIDRRAGDAAVVGLGHPVCAFSAAQLNTVKVPNPSPVVAAQVGTSSVAEAAALLGAGARAELVIAKVKGAAVTVAVARRRRPVGRVDVVGLGPGGARHRTPAATAAVRHAQVVIGYRVYIELCRSVIGPAAEVIESPIGAEVERCDEALRRAAAGQAVALVCSGDPGVFALATVALERAPLFGSPPVAIVPGVSADVAAAAALGAPLAHDHVSISLSDLLTPWPVIERRLQAAADADLVVALYNPRSTTRTAQLTSAVAILAAHRRPGTPVGIVTSATRPEQRVVATTLAELDAHDVGMFSMVIIGSSATRTIDGRMVTPRGYAT